jgi:hypothetical protein
MHFSIVIITSFYRMVIVVMCYHITYVVPYNYTQAVS